MDLGKIYAPVAKLKTLLLVPDNVLKRHLKVLKIYVRSAFLIL